MKYNKVKIITRDLETPRFRRIRKVYYGHYDSEISSPYPVIRIGGKYLKDYGFNIGDQIQLDLEPGCITITKVAESEPKSNH